MSGFASDAASQASFAEEEPAHRGKGSCSSPHSDRAPRDIRSCRLPAIDDDSGGKDWGAR